MRIFIQSPNINSPHGGIRVINEWANQLTDLGHRVVLYNQAGPLRCTLQKIKCKIVNTTHLISRSECLIVTSPHGAFLLDKDIKKKYIFLQMLEHLFKPTNERFFQDCIKLYQSNYPLFSISQWNMRILKSKFNNKRPIHYIGNGVNLKDFPITNKPKDYKTILLESPEPTNVTKDADKLAVQVAKILKERGYNIIGYGIVPPKDNIYDKFIVKPTIEQMNDLYERATIMIKATKYDARSTAPLEAGTKGTVTVRGIIEGDDDLTEQNSYKVGYSVDKLYDAAMFALQNKEETERRAENMKQHIQTFTPQYWINQVNQILCQES